MKNNGCIGCHQLGQLSTRTLPEGIGEYSSSVEAWVRRVSSGQSGEQMVNAAGRPARRRAVQVLRGLDRPDRQGRAAAHQADASAGPGAQHRRHDLGLGNAEAVPARPDRVRPALPDGQRLRSGVRLAGILDRRLADPRSGDAHGDVLQCAGARRQHDRRRSDRATRPATARSRRRPTGARSWSGTPRPTTTTPCSTATAGSGSRRADATRNNPDFCKKGSEHPSAKAFPVPESQRQLSMLDPKTMKYTFIDTCFQTHHLQFGYDKNDTLWTSSGGGTGVVGWLNLKMYEETGDARPLAGLDAADPRHQRRRQARRIHRAEPAARSEQGPAARDRCSMP